jgi:hypothetical protein
MDKLDKILLPALAKRGLAGTATSAQICFFATQWGKIAFIPISFSKGILKVSVTSCTASSELQMREEELIDFVNKKAKREIVKQLRIYNKS